MRSEVSEAKKHCGLDSLVTSSSMDATAGDGTLSSPLLNGTTTTATTTTDSRWRKYSLAVERCLLAFDGIEEWADSHAALTKLLKTLGTWPNYKTIPKKEAVAQALAMSLDPNLPAGIHARALEVYAYIFETMGIPGLSEDLALYTSGLFPFVQHASTAVKPIVLDLFKRYILALPPDVLGHVSRSLLLALLSGMEEDTSDFFEPILDLFDRLRAQCGEPLVYGHLWSIMVSSSLHRGAALSICAKKLLLLDTLDQVSLYSNGRPELLVKAISVALEDDHLLVKRAALELLLTHWDLESAKIDRIEKTLLHGLVNSALSVVLARDMSLNRRCFAWLLGKSEHSAEQMDHFRKIGLDKVRSAILFQLETKPGEGQDTFKVLVSLLDKYEIANVLTSALVWDLVKLVQSHPDLVAPAHNYFQAVEPFLLWQQMAHRLVSKDADISSCLKLLLPCIGKDVETCQIHVPACLILALEDSDVDLVSHLLSAIHPNVFYMDDDAAPWDAKRVSLFYKTSTDDRSVAGLQGPGLFATILRSLLQRSASAIVSGLEVAEWSTLIQKLLGFLPSDYHLGQEMNVDIQGWIQAALVEPRPSDFTRLEAVLLTFFELVRCRLVGPETMGNLEIRSFCVEHCLCALSNERPQYHRRTVTILQHCVRHFGTGIVQDHLLRSMNSNNFSKRLVATEAFTIIWKAGEQDSGELSIPLDQCIYPMIDSLHAAHLGCRRRAENWLRMGIRSYDKILEPILTRIVEYLPQEDQSPDEWSEKNDLGMALHGLEVLLILVRFGGQALMKAAKSSNMGNSHHPRQLSDPFIGSSNLLAHLVKVCHQSLAISDNGDPYSETLVYQIHLCALDTLQIVLTRGDLASSQLCATQTLLQDRAKAMIEAGELDLQNKLLHVLHLAISLGAGKHRQTAKSNHNTPQTVSVPTMSPKSPQQDGSEGAHPAQVPSVEELTSIVHLAIAVPSNKPVLQNWLDFLSMLSPYLKHSLCRAVIPIISSLTSKLAEEVNEETRLECGFVEQDFNALLSTIERLVVFALQDETTDDLPDGKNALTDRLDGAAGLIGYVSTIFTGEANVPQSEDKLLSAKLMCLRDVIRTYYGILVLVQVESGSDVVQPLSESNRSHIRSRLVRSIERFHKIEPQCVNEGLIETWIEKDMDLASSDVLFDMLQLLASNSQTVLAIIFDAVRARLNPHSVRRARSIAVIAIRNLMQVLEIYVRHLEGPVAVLVWHDAVSFFRDLGSSTTLPKALNFPLLRTLHALCCKVVSTPAAEDRKMRKDIQELYPRYVDACVAFYGKSSESSSWIRRGPLASSDSSAELTEKAVETQEGHDQNAENEAMIVYSAEHLVPELRSILNDPDRAVALCVNMMHYIVTPHVRSTLRKDTTANLRIYDLFVALCRETFAIKAWKPLALEAFYDPHFFSMPLSLSAKWRPVIDAMVQQERSTIPELLVRASATGTIFTSREQESLNRSYSIRRLAYVLFSSQSNAHLPQLPPLQEKVLELVRAPLSAGVTAELYLLMRVMLLRFSAHHLQRLWPLVMADLLKMLKPSARADASTSTWLSPASLLSACKLIDLAMVMQVEDFQFQQWIFERPSTVTSDQTSGLPSQIRRPFINLDKVGTFDELEGAMSRLSEHSMKSLNSTEPAELDYIESWVEHDLLDQM